MLLKMVWLVHRSANDAPVVICTQTGSFPLHGLTLTFCKHFSSARFPAPTQFLHCRSSSSSLIRSTNRHKNYFSIYYKRAVAILFWQIRKNSKETVSAREYPSCCKCQRLQVWMSYLLKFSLNTATGKKVGSFSAPRKSRLVGVRCTFVASFLNPLTHFKQIIKAKFVTGSHPGTASV